MAYGKLVEWKSFIELISNMHLSLLHTKTSMQETVLEIRTHLTKSSPSK